MINSDRKTYNGEDSVMTKPLSNFVVLISRQKHIKLRSSDMDYFQINCQTILQFEDWLTLREMLKIDGYSSNLDW
jgi:hypothetical protein